MRFTVTWTRAALDELARIWNQAEDRGAVSAASYEMDRRLGASPESEGESRSGNVRVMFVRPLGADYEVSQLDCTVRVLTVWRVRSSDGFAGLATTRSMGARKRPPPRAGSGTSG
jgi:plasmid stabilization system protein ParE